MSVPHKTNVTKLKSSYISAQEEKKQKASRRRRIAVVRFTFLGIVLALVSSAFVYTMQSQAKDIEAKQASKKQLEQKLDKLEKQQKQLEEEIKKLHDDEYIAELARKKYYLSKDGEIIFVTPEK
ncbi:FtsB family cell division protein [Saccharococcus caldoxylosilyticus]|jgi:cell division protein DivIC|uniref:FtsB family cell division protein n=1 Tax=Saccharococcus caldoxylosilyticus TaxID=81408 RepID=UPI00030E44D5|nr:septum formation initiator family protein [Parageobacillus caldoxylosilyticus]